MGETHPRVVIVGAGHAGGTAAAYLRQFGYEGEIQLIGEELLGPYQRPPLSKAYLKGETDSETLKLRPDSYYHQHHITLRMGAKATGIDREKRLVMVEGEEPVHYDKLILATGSTARKLTLPGADLQGLHELRNVADAEGLKPALAPGKRLALIGGGYIGLEAAASGRQLGAEVVVLELASRVLARVASPPLSAFFEAQHRAHGVEILTDVQTTALEGGPDGFVAAVTLSDGRRIPCDAVLVGIGGVSCDGLARDSGLRCENGVVVDENARTSDPDIFAIGDMTWRPMTFADNRSFRLESVQNALEQAKQAAAAITGKPAPAPEVPWFWSDQYDLKLQIAGVAFDADETVVRGSPDNKRFSVFFLKDGRIQAVEAVNAPQEFMAGKMYIGSRKAVSREKLADSSIPMKEVVL